MTISFTGHASVCCSAEVKILVKEQIRKHIVGDEQVICYLGGCGEFDQICACACRELKQEYRRIELVYVTPYLHVSEQQKIKELERTGLYDMSVYPPIEKTPPKFAIVKRNEWMMANADLVIAYVAHNYGGAYRSLQVARRKKKKIINIFDFFNK